MVLKKHLLGSSQLGIWGRSYSARDLGNVLRDNKVEFLDLCRRVTIDEVGAQHLVTAIEVYLEGASSSELDARSSSASGKKSIRHDFQLLNQSPRLGSCSVDAESEEVNAQINLIQLLAEVHRAKLPLRSQKSSTIRRR